MERLVYRGSIYENIQEGKPVFFSSSDRFAKDYGEVKKYRLFLNNPFHTCLEDTISLLLEKTKKIIDPYNKDEYHSYDELVGSGLLYHDTWELFEPFIEEIKMMGFDGMVIYEGGNENFIAFYSYSYREAVDILSNEDSFVPTGTKEMDLDELNKIKNADNMMRYISNTGSRLQNSIYNSIEVKWLIDLENQGLGQTTITQYLDALQDRYSNGQSHLFPDLDHRRKPVEPNRMEELIREVATYRRILQNLIREFTKARKGSQLRLYSVAIQDIIDRIDRGEKLFKFDEE